MGSLSLLTPWAALIALTGVVPLAAHLRRERRARRVRETLRLADPAPGPGRVLLAALLTIPALAGLAAAQPVIDRAATLRERADAEIFFVLDVTRSMRAASGPNAPTRFERASAAALTIRQRLPGIPSGLAVVTDVAVPHLFPTSNTSTFRATLATSIKTGGLGSQTHAILGTDLTALAAFASQNFFSPAASKRLLIVLTDGETRTVKPRVANLRKAGIRTIFVHVWGTDEAIFNPTGAEPQYHPDPASNLKLEHLASLVEGAVFGEDETHAVTARAREELGKGPMRRRNQRDLLGLMPYVTLAAALPLALILRGRNL